MKPWFKCESIFAPLILRQQNFLHLIIFRSEATEDFKIFPWNLSIYLSPLNCKILQIFTQVKIRKNFDQCGGSWLYQERMWNILCYCPRLHLKQLWWLLQNFMGSPNSGLGVRYPWFYGRVRSLSAVTHFLPRMGPRFLSSFSSVCNLFQLFC